MSVEVEKSEVTVIQMRHQVGSSRISVDTWLYVADQLRKAVAAGMPPKTTVEIRDSRAADGLLIGRTISATHTIREPVS